MKKKVLLLLILVSFCFLLGEGKEKAPALAQGTWVSPIAAIDLDGWSSENNARDDSTSSRASTAPGANNWSGFLELAVSPLASNKVRYYCSYGSSSPTHWIDLDDDKDSVWVDVYEGTFTGSVWEERAFDTGTVIKARVRLKSSGGDTLYLNEFDFWEAPAPTPTPTPTPSTGQWVSPTGYIDGGGWYQDYNIYDEDVNSRAHQYVGPYSWSSFMELTHAPTQSDRVRFNALRDSEFVLVDLDVLRNGSWENVYYGDYTNHQWVETSFTQGSVSAARLRFYKTSGGNRAVYFYEFDFWETAAPTPTPTPTSTPTPTPTSTPTPTPTPTPAPVTKTMIVDSGSGGGDVTATGSIDPTDPFTASERGWRIANYPGSVDFPSYDALKETYNAEDAQLISNITNITSSGKYKWNCPGSERICEIASSPCNLGGTGVDAVIFVNGNLNITTNFRTTPIEDTDDPLTLKNECNSSLAFIVKDNITVDPTVNNIYGIFYAGGTISTGSSSNRLYVFGSLLANGFSLGRNLDADNANYPAEQVIFMPKYFLDLGSSDLLGQQKVTWREK